MIDHLPVYLKDFVRFASLTGWRKGEIVQLTWDDIDRRAKTIRLRPEGSKTDRGRTIALPGFCSVLGLTVLSLGVSVYLAIAYSPTPSDTRVV